MAPGGYAWWYLDALSDDGREALVVIAFIGSVFSPYYAWRRARRGDAAAPAEAHVAINVALSRPGAGSPGHAWTMTERGAGALDRGAAHLAIGPSAIERRGDALHLTLDERGLPWPLPSRVRGRIVVHPVAPAAAAPVALDAAGVHHWWPLAPLSRVEVDLPLPGWRWQGQGYLDSNRGGAPLSQAFSRWHWARAALDRHRAAVVYDVDRRDGSRQTLALAFDTHGRCQPFDAPPERMLARSGWGLARATRSDADARVLHTLTDAPFYARGLVGARWRGAEVRAMHESLDLDRFDRPWVQAMLPFRMPRRGG